MSDRPRFDLRNRWQKVACYAGVWTLLSGVYAADVYFCQFICNQPVDWGLALRRGFENWYTWGFLSLGILWLANRVRFESGRGARWFFIHSLAGAVSGVLYVTIYAWLLSGQESIMERGTIFRFDEVFRKMVFHYMLVGLLIYWMIVLVHHGWHYYQRFRERELQASELQKQLAQAKLDALRMQLNPHFLFNTLHAISALIHENPETADRIVVRLSELLRQSLDHSETQEVPLRRELDFLNGYIEIEQTRFQERLQVNREIDPGLEEALVPCLILQPLVENAIRHGIEPREDVGRITIRARRNNGRLELSVSNNGESLPDQSAASQREGIGLSNTRSRLRHLYGDDHQFELKGIPEGGVEVRLSIPYHVGNGN